MSKTIVLSLAILLFISSAHSQDLDPVDVRITLDQALAIAMTNQALGSTSHCSRRGNVFQRNPIGLTTVVRLLVAESSEQTQQHKARNARFHCPSWASVESTCISIFESNTILTSLPRSQ